MLSPTSTTQKMWYSQDLKRRKNWYSPVASAYKIGRPTYPQKLVNRAVELAQLPQEAVILEIGCGPGTATNVFAEVGFSMVCLEPSQAFCQLAEQSCAKYPNVKIINTAFEEWELELEQFDAVLAANSFHWVSADIKYQKAAAAIKENGSIILLWNTPPQPKSEILQLLNEVYQTRAPFLAHSEDIKTHQENIGKFGEELVESGLFKNLVSEEFMTEVDYNTDNYLALLNSLSPYIALEAHKRDSLFASLRETLENNCPQSIPTSYLSVVQVAQKMK